MIFTIGTWSTIYARWSDHLCRTWTKWLWLIYHPLSYISEPFYGRLLCWVHKLWELLEVQTLSTFNNLMSAHGNCFKANFNKLWSSNMNSYGLNSINTPQSHSLHVLYTTYKSYWWRQTSQKPCFWYIFDPCLLHLNMKKYCFGAWVRMVWQVITM